MHWDVPGCPCFRKACLQILPAGLAECILIQADPLIRGASLKASTSGKGIPKVLGLGKPQQAQQAQLSTTSKAHLEEEAKLQCSHSKGNCLSQGLLHPARSRSSCFLEGTLVLAANSRAVSIMQSTCETQPVRTGQPQ